MAPSQSPAADAPRRDDAPARDDLSLEDLAKILDLEAELDDEARARLARFIRAEPRCADRVREVEALAAEAGLPDEPWTALDLNRRLDQLLAAGEWKDPAEVLGVPDLETAGLAGILRIAKARAARSDNPGRFLELKERLIEAEIEEVEEVLKPFARRLIPLSPDAAWRALGLAWMLYDWKHDE